MKTFVNILKCKCPNCKKEKMFKKGGNLLMLNIPKMHKNCPLCSYTFERETGFFFGAMFVSYALAAALMIICLIIFWYFLDLTPPIVFAIIVLLAILSSTWNFKVSRSIWLYIFHKH